MLSFARGLNRNNGGIVVFVTEKYDYKDKNNLLPKDLVKKIDSFLKILKAKNKKEEISSIDISEEKKCFIIKVKNKHENFYFEELGGTFFAYLKKFKNVNSIDIYADSLNENKDKLIKFFSEFIFGFNLKSYSFDKYKTLDNRKIDKKINYKIITTHENKIENIYKYYNSIKEGVFLTRDLVSEPPNILSPKAYVQEIKNYRNLD